MYPTISRKPKPTGKRVRSLDQYQPRYRSGTMNSGDISRVRDPNIRSLDSPPYEYQQQNRIGSFPTTVLPPLNVVKRKPVPIRDEDKPRDTNPSPEETKHNSKIFREGMETSQRYDKSAKPQSGYTAPLSPAPQSRHQRNPVGIPADISFERRPQPDPRNHPPSVYELLIDFHRQSMEDVREEEGEPDEEEEEMAAASASLAYWRLEYGGHDSTEDSKKSSREESTVVPDLVYSVRQSGGSNRQQLRKDSVLSSPDKLRTRSIADDSRNGRVRNRDKESKATEEQDSGRRPTPWWRFE